MSRTALRISSAAVSAGLAAAIGLWLVARRGPADTVRLVDARERVEALLAAEAAEPTAPPSAAAGAREPDPAAAAGPDPLPPAPAIVRRPLPEDVARAFFPGIDHGQEYDEHLLCRRPKAFEGWVKFKEHPRGGMWIKTNAQGFRKDVDVRADKPDVRVIVVGDSHVDGVCDNVSSFPNRLEETLAQLHPERSFEVLNAATGGWGFYNYLGALEGLAALEPDLFVVVVYGGNDFFGDILLHHYHRREKLPGNGTGRALRKVMHLGKQGENAIAAQYLVQVAHFLDHPGEEDVARDLAIGVTAEIARQCRERGIELLCVYLPPWPHAQPALCAEAFEKARAELDAPAEAFEVDERLAAAWLDWLERAGIPTVDLRPTFRAIEGRPLYWSTDYHLNLAGHRAVVEALRPHVEQVLGLER